MMLDGACTTLPTTRPRSGGPDCRCSSTTIRPRRVDAGGPVLALVFFAESSAPPTCASGRQPPDGRGRCARRSYRAPSTWPAARRPAGDRAGFRFGRDRVADDHVFAPRVRTGHGPDRTFRCLHRVSPDFGRWWPRAYTWSQDALERIAIGSAVGELCIEVGPHGFRCDWGRVLAVEPPHRLVLAWQIGPTRFLEPDPERASEVQVTFDTDGDETRVVVEHRHLARHGDGAESYAEAMGSEHGWPYILGCFAASLTG